MSEPEHSGGSSPPHWVRSNTGSAAAAIQAHYSIKGLSGGRPLGLMKKKRPPRGRMAPQGLARKSELSYDDKMLQYAASLTVAEKAGLVESPRRPLTEEEWKTVKSLSDSRSDVSCSICREPFRDTSQLILACTHSFHQRCFLSYLHYAGSETSKCPMCRAEAHDWTTHDGGLNVWRTKCATTIQCRWRGYIQRSRLMREQLPPGSLLRRKYTLRMLEAASRRAEHLGQARSDAVEKLLKDMDRTTLESSRVLRESLAALEMFRKSSSLDKAEDSGPTLPDADIPNWLHEAVANVLERGDCDCPICYDHKCLDSFESFKVFETRSCPMCRQTYDRRPWPCM
ncbi:RING finger protein, putative [Perkinsus marinus ATCC 50983]|uniref:Anaphase-promoting complex subunit 11 n=1 Tax=Perkinsus marinus (strain ATCC 50983 / TXsc) TaxID=423536 RepID=C5LLJ7_PERM5|nr:RING finger protein, putative [Perkinsus marinus ATCC 50983]EER02395.1 RING finger protein, putative [Perkinsus marinus ATCC 50983]|eukprot:XP_002769677.1 RING finger protein, putative [Perkinsus marinus ATCC 50983]